MLDTLTFDSGRPGPSFLVLGAIHGNEPCGTHAIARFGVEFRSGIFALKKGRVIAAPICNPGAYIANKRFVDINLNRAIAKHTAAALYEHGLANEVTALIDNCDVVLDLHSYSSGRKPFLFLDNDTPANRAFAAALNIPDWVTGWDALYAGEPSLSSGDTMSYAAKAGKPALLIECGLHTDPEAAYHGYNALRAALAHFGMVDPYDTAPPAPPKIHRMTHLFVKKKEGKHLQDWQHLDLISKGMPIAQYDDGELLTAPVDGAILLPGKNTHIGEEWFYFGVAE